MYRQGCFEFRCSLMLSSAPSLEKWGRELNIAHPKKVGLYDYNKILYQDSDLSADEQDYDKYDVISLYECLAAQMEKNGDDININTFNINLDISEDAHSGLLSG